MSSKSSTTKAQSAQFFGAPQPLEFPDADSVYDASSNPILRGYSLLLVSKLISSSTFLQNIFWKLNKLDKLKELKELDIYEPRFDPTVVPILASGAENGPLSLKELPKSRARENASAHYTCADYHEAYTSGKFTPSDVVELLLPLIRSDTSTPGKHSIGFAETKADIIRAAAKASTARYREGKPLSMLDGVPLAVKDEVDLRGYKRRLGSKLDFTNPGNGTAWCVEKWQEAGGIVVGKSNMHEVGLDTSNNNPNTGTPPNPHNSGYYTGGSSGGSAYVVAAGICPVALGVDGGGSIRLPASFCGVYGLKPSHGRVSSHPTQGLATSVGVNGPIASSIDDLALAYRIMAQPDPEQRQSAQFPTSLLLLSPSPSYPKLLGIPRAWVSRSSPEVQAMFNSAIKHFTSVRGYTTVDVSIPLLPQAQKAHALTILSEIRSGLSPAQIGQLTPHNQLLLNVAGSHASTQDFLAAQRIRDLLMRHLAALWKQHAGMIVVTPTTPEAGWKVAHPGDVVKGGYGVSDMDTSLRTMEYVFLANFTGNPAISMPMGYKDEKGGAIPVGLMGMAIWGAEEQLLSFARDGDGMLNGSSSSSSSGSSATDSSANSSHKQQQQQAPATLSRLPDPSDGEGWLDVLAGLGNNNIK